MKATRSPALSSVTALTLKVVGLIFILSALLDYFFIAIPLNLLQRDWQLGFIAQVVERGATPMIGIAFLLLGYWISNSLGAARSDKQSPLQDLRLWALLFASLLGLIFLLMAPIHLNNVRLQSQENLKQINQRATEAETQIKTRSDEITALINDSSRLAELEKAINSGQYQGDQLAQLQAIKQQIDTFKQNPQSLNQQLTQAQQQLRSRKQEIEKQTNTQLWKLGWRTSVLSLLLSIGYITIGWMGLKRLFSAASHRKAST